MGVGLSAVGGLPHIVEIVIDGIRGVDHGGRATLRLMAEMGEKDGEDIQGGEKGYSVHGGFLSFCPLRVHTPCQAIT